MACSLSVSGGTGERFFSELSDRLKLYHTNNVTVNESTISQEFTRLKNLEGVSNEQERGRVFDYFVAIVFSQIDGVECLAREETDRGEVDVIADFTGADSRLHRLTGNFVPIENKWENKKTKQRDTHTTSEGKIIQYTEQLFGFRIYFDGRFHY